jgi:indolepyruvate ferredoxin oxidoreductase
MTFGAWMLPAFRALAPLKVLRGTAFDVFGYTGERRRERAWRDSYMDLAREIAASLSAQNKPQYAALAALPEQVRGFGHVKLRNLDKALAEQTRLRAQLQERAAA